MGSSLKPGAYLKPGESIESENKGYTLIYQTDGNFVLYAPGGRPMWHSNTAGKPTGKCIMQDDGNLVIYDSNNKPVWASDTYGNNGAHLALEDNGDACIYGKRIWKAP